MLLLLLLPLLLLPPARAAAPWVLVGVAIRPTRHMERRGPISRPLQPPAASISAGNGASPDMRGLAGLSAAEAVNGNELQWKKRTESSRLRAETYVGAAAKGRRRRKRPFFKSPRVFEGGSSAHARAHARRRSVRPLAEWIADESGRGDDDDDDDDGAAVAAAAGAWINN